MKKIQKYNCFCNLMNLLKHLWHSQYTEVSALGKRNRGLKFGLGVNYKLDPI